MRNWFNNFVTLLTNCGNEAGLPTAWLRFSRRNFLPLSHSLFLPLLLPLSPLTFSPSPRSWRFSTLSTKEWKLEKLELDRWTRRRSVLLLFEELGYFSNPFFYFRLVPLYRRKRGKFETVINRRPGIFMMLIVRYWIDTRDCRCSILSLSLSRSLALSFSLHLSVGLIRDQVTITWIKVTLFSRYVKGIIFSMTENLGFKFLVERTANYVFREIEERYFTFKVSLFVFLRYAWFYLVAVSSI